MKRITIELTIDDIEYLLDVVGPYEENELPYVTHTREQLKAALDKLRTIMPTQGLA